MQSVVDDQPCFQTAHADHDDEEWVFKQGVTRPGWTLAQWLHALASILANHLGKGPVPLAPHPPLPPKRLGSVPSDAQDSHSLPHGLFAQRVLCQASSEHNSEVRAGHHMQTDEP